MLLTGTQGVSHRGNTADDTEVNSLKNAPRQPIRHSRTKPKRGAIVILDFGSQYSMLLVKRVRALHVYCEIFPYDVDPEKVLSLEPKGFILSGGPASVYDPGAPTVPDYVLDRRVPILGICYGMQALVHQLGGKVVPGKRREYGRAMLQVTSSDPGLFASLEPTMPVWMSHGDEVVALPEGFSTFGSTEDCPYAVIGDSGNIFGIQFPPIEEDYGGAPIQLPLGGKFADAVQPTFRSGIFGLQFHPEVAHTPDGASLLRNFLFNVCGCKENWTTPDFIADSVLAIRKQVGGHRIVCALSGGIDSAVAATLVHRAVGDQLTCIFVNNGLLRREEPERIREFFGRNLKMNLLYVDARERFLLRLAGVTEPEEKRLVIGEEFIRVFEEEAKRLGDVKFLAQGTLYPDVIESTTSATGAAARIKSHHNVGGLPERMALKLVEPVRTLFKDEVRQVGLELGLPEDLVWRHSFPGPGLAIRCLGEVTESKLDVLRGADWIVMNEIQEAGWYRDLWQAFAVLTESRTVGVMGDHRTYDYVVAVRAVTSEDAMTADWAPLPHEMLARISNRIVNEVLGVNRVVYDITSKPPGTIEWE